VWAGGQYHYYISLEYGMYTFQNRTGPKTMYEFIKACIGTR